MINLSQVDRNFFAEKGVVIVGDIVADQFLSGSISRVSREAPVFILKHEKTDTRPGGAANAAANIASLGGTPILIGVIGEDASGSALCDSIRQANVDLDSILLNGTTTTTKIRVLAGQNYSPKQQVIRIDYENDGVLDQNIRSSLIDNLRNAADTANAIVISDYLKGCITRTVVHSAVANAAPGVPVLVDPKIPHIEYYAGTTLVTPNHHEAEGATNTRIRSEDEARAAARQFRTRAQCANVLMTRGDQGMWLLSDENEGHLPSAAREVADVTGAGDTVIATMAVMLAAGATMSEAARLANETAGLSVAKFGPATVSLVELLKVVEASATT